MGDFKEKSFNRRIIAQITFSDLILVLIALFAAYYSFTYFQPGKGKKHVYIYKDEQLWGDYALHKDQVIVIDTHNSVEISRGKVRMHSADCPDKRCMKMGYVENLPIICLPNKVVVEIKTEAEKRKFILH